MRIWSAHRRWIVGQLLIWVLGAVFLRVAVVPAETCPRVSAARVKGAIDAGAAWLVRGQRGDGRFLYGYDSSRRRVSTDYNVVRHAGVLDSLYRTGHLDAADAGLGYVLRNVVRHDGWSAFSPPEEDVSSGGNALLLAALVHRRDRTGDRRYDEFARGIARFLVSQVRADGSVLLSWSQVTRRPVPGVFGKFSTGEVFYALALMHRSFPADGWERPARRVAHYLATRRDRVEGNAIRQNDHWAAYGLAELAPYGLTADEARYGRFLAGYFGYLVRFESAHTGQRLSPMSESGAELGTMGEALGALRRLTNEDERFADLRDDLRERDACLAGILVDRQTSATAADPNARGAWFVHDYTQMDDQQHAIAALLGARGAVR